MLAFDDALAKVLSSARQVGTERVELGRASGRVLRQELRAGQPIPAFDYSAMDGYAVRVADFAGAGPWKLPVRGESQTGHIAPELVAASACRIFTGAALPEGSDAVVMQEDVQRNGDAAQFASAPSLWQHVRKQGEDLAAGAVALAAGTRLKPTSIGLIAALDHASVLVSRRPRVSIVCTGDELRPPGSSARPGSIPESNGYALAALLRQVGADASLAPLAADDRGTIESLLAAAAESADLVLTVGGVSVGDHDLVRPALESLGATLEFYKVRIKPGKPLTFGRLGRAAVLGLPGNPVSAQVTFALFGAPLLRAMQGDANPVPPRRRVELLSEIRQKPGRRAFNRGVYRDGGVLPATGQASGSVVSMAWADALIEVPEEAEALPQGSLVSTLALVDL
ncbi:MAG: molybdopterin molybdotransferase MoeA [Polyangiaceae bacterium]